MHAFIFFYDYRKWTTYFGMLEICFLQLEVAEVVVFQQDGALSLVATTFELL
jgi:hypothetical protein